MSHHPFDSTEITEEFQKLRLSYLKKLDVILELEQKLLKQKSKSESFTQIGRILAAQYLKLKVLLQLE